ncbi:MAG: CDP-alcohol phosphatidyltransferase family protein [Flavobacteriales bacterium]
MKIKQNLPNLLTLGNLLSGCLGIVACLRFGHQDACIYILIAAVLDFFDGSLARALKVESPIGKDLDSLADVVTFGVLPGFMAMDMLENTQSTVTLPFDAMIYLAMLIPLMSAVRLAKFNNDNRQTTSFIGLPTPANGIFFVGLSCALSGEYFNFIHNFYAILSITMVMAFLLVSELPMFSLKLKGGSWKDYSIQIIFLTISLISLLIFKWAGLSIVILIFILLSIIQNLVTK